MTHGRRRARPVVILLRWRYTITLVVLVLALSPLVVRGIVKAHDCTARGGIPTRGAGCAAPLDDPTP